MWLVNGSYYPEYEMSEREFSSRVLGDVRPPPRVWRLSVSDGEGDPVTLSVDPTGDAHTVALRFPAGGDQSGEQEWIEDVVGTTIDRVGDLIERLDEAAQARIIARLKNFVRSGQTPQA